ncbi:MAG TPA: hypothetical protein VF338_03115, partial [Leptolinea sp.]
MIKRTPLEEWIGRKINCPQNEISRQSIEDYQINKINETLHLVRENSRFYRSLLKNCAPQISSLVELAEYPFTNAHDIRDYPEHFLCVSQSEIS